MSDIYGLDYARSYDSLYREKDYEHECGVLRDRFDRLAPRPLSTILDLGCGTGGHAYPLARAGYEVVGVDRSEHMIDIARDRQEEGAQPEFIEGDLRQIRLGRTFDAALMMFAVLGYQVGNEDVRSALETVKAHLSPGGLFLFDFWYGPAVLATGPGETIREIETAHGTLLRHARGTTEADRHCCVVEIGLWKADPGRGLARSTESHEVRFFFPMELRLYLDLCGLDLIELQSFPQGGPPTPETWNVLGVAKAR